MSEHMNLLDPNMEPSDKQLEQLMQAVAAEVAKKAEKAREEREYLLLAVVSEACSRHSPVFADFADQATQPR
jgi:hypothetical protein